MSKFDLRDISDKLTGSKDTEGVVDTLLAYLRAVQPDWHPTLAFYEVSRDALVRVYDRETGRLQRRDIIVPVEQLPARLVRKFFHPSAFFNATDRRSLLARLFQSSPSYEPDSTEHPQIQPIAAGTPWHSCVCMPLADQEDLIAMLVIVSPRRNAFGSRAVGEIIPVKSLAAMSLARHLYARDPRPVPDPAPAAQVLAAQQEASQTVAAEFQNRLRELQAHSEQLAADNQHKTQRLEALTREIEALDRNSSAYRHELSRVKSTLDALEEQSGAAAAHLQEAFSQLAISQSRLGEMQRTMNFLKEVFQVLAQEHDEAEFSRMLVSWFCEHFGVDRCSLMRMEDSRESLSIFAHRGLDEAVANRVRVRVGQGIAGWVAHNRKPLFVRMKQEVSPVQGTGQDAYNSDSFISVPLVFKNRLYGVLNLSNKRDGDPFDESDLERAMLAGSLLAMSLGGQEQTRALAAWV